ncbi:hypothetical protein MTO96_031724 [Rhipicephalus appendiculatus]
MDVVHVEGTTLREEDYDAADWTTIIGTCHGKSQSKARMKDVPEVSEKQKAPQERTETLDASPWRPKYRPNPAQLRATQQVTRKSANGSTSAACYKGDFPLTGRPLHAEHTAAAATPMPLRNSGDTGGRRRANTRTPNEQYVHSSHD